MSKKPIERRWHSGKIEVRAAGDVVSLRGYAAVFDSESYGEVIRPGAFSKTLAERDDVRLLVNHDGVPIARTKSGTMRLSVDAVGLLVEADLDPTNPTVQELMSAMERGDIDQMSFAFVATKDAVVDGVRQVLECKLYDVSVVTYPWYEATSAELMSAERLELCLRALPAEQRDAIIINIGGGEVCIDGGMVADMSTDASTDNSVDSSTESETELPDMQAASAARLAEARALLASLG
ncbi:HK97 family phage prohead protease [bacterium]|nr:HK97 family phage prohead protease [bacterium]NDC95356.1 HK97 family phage prohead protease [bacterium]NDD85069.1 HK97 family phage prohead protease [bacterium]NDG19172.1 HK97 family phage prohead protease [Betaproteobacteria bacterium]